MDELSCNELEMMSFQSKKKQLFVCESVISSYWFLYLKMDDIVRNHIYKYELKYFVYMFNSGGIGAKRFCSSKDLGNYCNYVQNKGDRMEYRSCIFTCSTDGCNHSTTISVNQFTVVLFATASILFSAIAYLK